MPCRKPREDVARIILTASGGPFRDRVAGAIAAATPAQAVAHPNWSMGAKISVDSATMMNKGLELIEAPLSVRPPVRADRHRRSIRSRWSIRMVEFVDGSVLAQLGSPDMRIPIAYALAWPERMATPAQRLDLAAIGAARLRSARPGRAFPALRLARERRSRRAAPRRSCSTPRTRWPSRASSPADLRFRDIAAWSTKRLSPADFDAPRIDRRRA